MQDAADELASGSEEEDDDSVDTENSEVENDIPDDREEEDSDEESLKSSPAKSKKVGKGKHYKPTPRVIKRRGKARLEVEYEESDTTPKIKVASWDDTCKNKGVKHL